MPSTRELLRDVRYDKAISQSAYVLLKALVEAVEPEDTDATLRKLYQALIRDRSEARVVIAGLREELSEAQAEIERLRKQRNDYRADLAEELRRRECLILAKVAACDAEEVMRADAEIGRLVRGMDKNTVLLRLPSGRFHTVRSSPDSKDFWNWDRAVGAICVANPAEALRSIQEVGDAEA